MVSRRRRKICHGLFFSDMDGLMRVLIGFVFHHNGCAMFFFATAVCLRFTRATIAKMPRMRVSRHMPAAVAAVAAALQAAARATPRQRPPEQRRWRDSGRCQRQRAQKRIITAATRSACRPADTQSQQCCDSVVIAMVLRERYVSCRGSTRQPASGSAAGVEAT